MYDYSRNEVVYEVQHELLHKERLRRGVVWSVLQVADIKEIFTLEQTKGKETIDLVE